MKTKSRESNLARMRRIIAESPRCECGAEAILSERTYGKTEHYCLTCRTGYVPATEADILALLASL